MVSRLNIIYTNLLQRLADYTIAYAGFQSYYDSFSTQAKMNRLFELAEIVANNQAAVIQSRDDNVIHNDFQPLSIALTELATEFPDYPAGRITETLLMIKIINVIEQEVSGSGNPFNLSVQVDENLFCLEPITRMMKPSNFLFEDGTSTENSLVLINLSDLQELQDFLDNNPFSVELRLHLLIQLGRPAFPLIAGQYALIRFAQKGHSDAIYSCAALHLVKAGYLIHQPVSYSGVPTVSAARRILSDKEFQQFSDSLMILSEYNSQQDILDKYLRIYHLIEHFMFRKPIVELERRRNNRPFSIRDFRNLYRSVEQSEAEALKALLKTVMILEIEPGISFINKMFVEWQALHPVLIADVSHINRLFDLLQINKNAFSYTAVTADKLTEIFQKLVYAFRNSIVHNKATEFHLNHETMTSHHETGNAAQVVIEKFLLPWLEQISFYLIIEDNDLVWYHNPHLILFNT
ncbi:hypothetical protein [Pontibacter beigongshangensis]|uniref:hypothetical protein n=1 Tax=Pontibacter beigongshangensis TaxID=2574733 RepID=UPI00164FE787|nr:hypothetical protein [Pontibacter beigongshangensis]